MRFNFEIFTNIGQAIFEISNFLTQVCYIRTILIKYLQQSLTNYLHLFNRKRKWRVNQFGDRPRIKASINNMFPCTVLTTVGSESYHFQLYREKADRLRIGAF